MNKYLATALGYIELRKKTNLSLIKLFGMWNGYGFFVFIPILSAIAFTTSYFLSIMLGYPALTILFVFVWMFVIAVWIEREK